MEHSALKWVAGLFAVSLAHVTFGVVPASLYAEHCAQCHDASAATHAPSLEALHQVSPETVLLALSPGGVMQGPGKSLRVEDRRSLAGYVTGKKFGLGTPNAPARAFCKPRASKAAESPGGARWEGWGGDAQNTRFQAKDAAGLALTDIPRLKLKWAFAFPNASSANAPAVVAGGRIFVGSTNHTVYSLDAATACIHWAFEASSAVRGAIVLARVAPDTRLLGFFGDDRANVYALDPDTGKMIWTINAETHARPTSLFHGSIPGTVKVHNGVVFVPVSSSEEAMAAVDPKYECCKSRGAVIALNAATGREIWRTETIREPAEQSGVNEGGTPRWGPSGVGAWTTPTLDVKRNALYIGTGDNHSVPPSNTSDAILALDMTSGRILWAKQFFSGDTFAVACFYRNQSNCPIDAQGPDFDFASPPILIDLPNGKRALIAGQKSGMVHALDPDNQGEVLWETRVAEGGLIGGVEFGMATDGRTVYVPVSDADMVRNDPSDPTSKSKDIVFVGDRNRGGGLIALDATTGRKVWHAKPVPCALDRTPCAPAQIAAATLIPGVVFSGSVDGHMRAYSTAGGQVVWDVDTEQEYDTVDGVRGHGGSISGPGPAVVNGVVYVNSGYGIFWMPGNMLLAFGK